MLILELQVILREKNKYTECDIYMAGGNSGFMQSCITLLWIIKKNDFILD